MGRKRPLCTSSSRVHITLTGRPLSFESMTASMMKSTSRLPRRPKPPPIKRSCSLTLSRGMPSSLAGASLAVVWLWVPAQISTASPEADTAATAFSGSIWA
jgi:hypothetical protein